MKQAIYSRQGCLRCRVRRKKCDEVKPICGSCRKNNIDCAWPGTIPAVRHVLPANQKLAGMYASLHMKDDFVDFPFQDYDGPVPSPVRFFSNGYPALRDPAEPHLLQALATFLHMLTSPVARISNIGHDHTFAAALQNLWIRDALLSFSAFVLSSRHHALRAKSYSYYGRAIRDVQVEIRAPQDALQREKLLVATLFLGMMEVSNPENTVSPLLHFDAVGRLLAGLAKDDSSHLSESAFIFRRIALESYLYHVSMLSLFYPKANYYTRINPTVEEQLSDKSSGVRKNLLIALDINIYRYLFELTLLGRVSTWTNLHSRSLDRVRTGIELAMQRSQNPIMDPTNPREPQFWALTRVALTCLRILALKVIRKDVLASSPEMVSLVGTAVAQLELCEIVRAWTGNFCWIFTILLCASYTKHHFELLQRRLEVFKKGMWGGDLVRMQRVLKAIKAKRDLSISTSKRLNRAVEPGDHDTLSLLTSPTSMLDL